MKNIIRINIVIILATIFSCTDPYENSTYQVYNVNPVSTYLNNHPENFSEWVKILKYADLYNAINQATELFTVLAPDNDAVQAFYKTKEVGSIEELGYEYARQLAQYHVMNDTINRDMFLKGGKLPVNNLFDEALSVNVEGNIGGDFGANAVYVNGEAHVTELATKVSNGYIYVLSSVLRPLVESCTELLDAVEGYDTFCQALDLTSWADSLTIISDMVQQADGRKIEQRRFYTVLSVSDAVFRQSGISSVEELAQSLGAGNDYKDKDNALFRYVGYHILNGKFTTDSIMAFEEGGSYKLMTPLTRNTALKISKESDGKVYMNYDDPTSRTQLKGKELSIEARNGYIHQIDGKMPITTDLKSFPFIWDFCDNSEIASYVNANGTGGQKYRTTDESEHQTDISSLAYFNYKEGYRSSVADFLPVIYHTSWNKWIYGWSDALYNDQLILNMGYLGSIEIETPMILPGTYRLTLQFGYATSQQFMVEASNGSTGGSSEFSFDNNVNNTQTLAPYLQVTPNANGGYDLDLYKAVFPNTITFTEPSTHKLRILMTDPAAQTNSRFRMQLDYLYFEPVN